MAERAEPVSGGGGLWQAPEKRGGAMCMAVVINASAGALVAAGSAAADPHGAAFAMIESELRAAGLEVVIGAVDGPLPARMKHALSLGPDALVVGGGDGTIACAAQVLAGTDVPLGILPLGTMNLMAKDLGLPLTIREAAAVLARGHTRRIDVGEVNGHVFLCNSILGAASRLGRQREKRRGGMSIAEYWRLVVAGVRSLGRYPALSVSIDTGNGERHRRTRALAVVNNDYDEGIGQVLTRSHLDRGFLAVYVARSLSVWRLIRIAAGMVLGNWRHTPGLEHALTDYCVVDSRRSSLRVMNDGEGFLLAPPLHYVVRPRALRVIVPRPPEAIAAVPTATEPS